MWIGRAAFGTIIILAQYLFAYNAFRTLAGHQIPAEKTATAPAVEPVPTA
jgi:hypothetical protein